MAKKSGDIKMLTIREVSEVTGAAVSSIRVWLNDDQERAKRFPNARKEDTPVGGYWLIPESDVQNYEGQKRGRPFKPDSELKHKRRVSKAQGN
jgi:hypothetical protein